MRRSQVSELTMQLSHASAIACVARQDLNLGYDVDAAAWNGTMRLCQEAHAHICAIRASLGEDAAGLFLPAPDAGEVAR